MKDAFANMPCYESIYDPNRIIGNLGNPKKTFLNDFGNFSHYFTDDDDTRKVREVVADLGFEANCIIHSDSITMYIPGYSHNYVGIVYRDAIQHLRNGTLLLRNCSFVGMLVNGFESFIKMEGMGLPFGVICTEDQFYFTFESEADFTEVSLKW